MSFNGAMYNFPPGDAPLNQQTHTPMPPSQSPPALGFQPQERVLPYNANTPSPSSSFSGTSLIDPLMIDNLAQDFNLEPTQRANLHAFVTVGNDPHYYLTALLLIALRDPDRYRRWFNGTI